MSDQSSEDPSTVSQPQQWKDTAEGDGDADASFTIYILGLNLKILPQIYSVVPTFNQFLEEHFAVSPEITPMTITLQESGSETVGEIIGNIRLSSSTTQNPLRCIQKALDQHLNLLNTYTEEVNRTNYHSTQQIPMEIILTNINDDEFQIAILWDNVTTPFVDLKPNPNNNDEYVITATRNKSARVLKTVFSYVLETQEYQKNHES